MMLKSYFLSALRNIFRNKLFSLANIVGLAIGIGCFFLSYHHLQYEYSYDRHYSKADHIYRLVTGDVAHGDGWVRVSAPLPVKIKTDVPEVQDFARVINLDKSSRTAVAYNNQTYYESGFFLAEPSVTSFFDLQLLHGNSDGLSDLKTIFIAKSKSDQLFGFDDPIGKVLRVNDQFEFTVGGVYVDFVENTHLQMDFMVSFLNLEVMLPGTSLDANWGQYNYFAYLLLHPQAEELAAEQKIQDLEIKLNETQTFAFDQINLQPVSDIHFQDNRGNLKPSTNARNIWIYGISALAILLISMINYINLSVAGSTKRLKEVGLRRTIGAGRGQLIMQFMGESLVTVLLATLLGLAGLKLALFRLANQLFNIEIGLDLSSPVLWLILVLITLSISLISGWYISYYIIKVQPIKALKGGVKLASGNNPVRNLLVGVQFIIAMTLLTSVLFIRSQMDFMLEKDIGMQKEGVINIPLYEPSWKEDIKLIKKELSNLAEVTSTSGTGFQPGVSNWHQTVWWENQQEDVSMNIINADVDLFQTLGLTLVEGDLEALRDQEEGIDYVLNESAVRKAGWNQAMGNLFSPFGPNNKKSIAGVVKDFNYKSLHHPIEPCVFVLGSRFEPDNLLVKIQSTNIASVIEKIKNILAELSPQVPFQYHFLDERFEALYAQEVQSKRIVSFYTYVAIFLSILGLFGMISFEVNERTKEMAIRKVLGISDLALGRLISNRFMKIILFSCLLATPLTWYLMDSWLRNFTYRIDLGFDLFLMSILIILSLIVCTIGIKLVQLNRANVAEVLKQE